MELNKDAEVKIRLGISAARMAEDVKYLASLGPRHPGTEREHQAAKYVQQEFGKARVQVHVDEVPGLKAWYHRETRVRRACAHHASAALVASGTARFGHAATLPASDLGLCVGS